MYARPHKTRCFTKKADMNVSETLPILSFIKVFGLFGYKDIFVNFEAPVKIVAAENGAGKTTLLNIIHALLSGRVDRLEAIDFERIEWRFFDSDQTLILPKAELRDGFNSVEARDWWKLSPSARRFHSSLTFEEASELAYVLRSGRPLDSPLFDRAWRKNPYSKDELKHFISTFAARIQVSPALDALRSKISTCMSGHSVLYLPTYRRIEADLVDYVKEDDESKSSDRLIYFGLGDVQRKLSELTERIRTDTFKGYLEINARTLDALLSEDDSASGQIALPSSLDLQVIELILNRIGHTSSSLIARLRHLHTTNTLMNPEHRVLRGYLENISQLYKKQQTSEESLQRFTEVVNRYWADSSDPKEFAYDKLQATVTLKNRINNKPIPLNALSSGEKQIVSIFSRLYLGEGSRYYVIIDEPELSLSIDWQKRFLLDIANAPGCENLLAITHSPFVFQNELQPFADPLEIHTRVTEEEDEAE